MRKGKSHGGLFLTLLFSLILHFSWSIPAWILLILHFAASLPIYWFWIALGAWLLVVLLRSCVIAFASRRSAAPKPVRENKNPYSVGQKQKRASEPGHDMAYDDFRRED